MSRQLPEKPNLEYLKKQAKELLRGMRQGKLSAAQHTLANEYGFATWARLKLHVAAQGMTPAQALKAAVCDRDAARVREVIERYPELRARIDDPLPDDGFGIHALFAAVQRTDRATIDVLLQAHSASRLGLMAELRELVAADPHVVHARGGDGQTPLHFASTVEVAEFLLENGAEIDARDVDHESTPAQYMLRVEQKRHYPQDRQDVARYLVERGCRTDILMTAALGDAVLVRRLLDADPGCIAMNVSDDWFPKQNSRAGGTIYIWKLGARRTAHAVARDFGHEHVFQLLLERTPEGLKLALACELGDEPAFHEFLRKHPDTVKTLSEADQRKLPDAAQSNNTKAVRLMLEAGWPVDAPGEMGATALHWAGFNGNAEMAREILRFHPTLELKSREYAGTALSWAIYASGNGWHRDTGDFAGVVQALREAGSVVPPHAEDLEPSEAVLEVLP